MTKYIKLLKNTGSILLGQFASKILTYLLLPIYTYILTTEEYGTYDLLTTTISLIIPIITLDIAEACFRFALDENYDKKEIFSIGFYICLFSAIIAVILYPLLTVIPIFSEYYVFFAFLLVNNAFQSFLMQFIKGCQRVKLYSLVGVINTILLLSLNLLFLLVLHWGLIGYFLAYIISSFLVNIIILFSIKFYKYLISPLKINHNNVKKLLKYSVPMMPNSVCWWVSNASDRYMLQYIIGTSELGIYSVSYKIPTILSVVSSIFLSAWSISAVEDFGTETSKKMYSNIYNSFFCAVSLVTSLLVLLAKPIATVLFQKDFFVAWKCSIFLLFAFLFNSLSSFLGSIYISAKKTNMLFFSTLVSAIVNIILNLVMIPKWGIYGAAIATLISYFFVWVVRAVHSKTIICFHTETIKHIITIVLLFIQIVIMFYEVKYKYLISFFLFVVMLFYNISLITKILKKKNK